MHRQYRHEYLVNDDVDDINTISITISVRYRNIDDIDNMAGPMSRKYILA